MVARQAPVNPTALRIGVHVVFALGIALWLANGIATGDRPIIVANAFRLAMLTLALKLHCRATIRNDSRPTG